MRQASIEVRFVGSFEIYADAVPFRDTELNWQGWCEILFSSDDFHVLSGDLAHSVVVDEIGGGDSELTYQYLHASADLVRRRLHLQGYTADRCRTLWERAASDYAELRKRVELKLDQQAYADSAVPIQFEEWVSQRAAGQPSDRNDIEPIDPMAALALHIDIFHPTSIWTDLTELDIGASFDKSLPLDVNLSSDFDHSDYVEPIVRVLILTEGKTDTRILSAALQQFYPEFRDVYQFMDFEGFKVEGSASALTRMVKSFAGARFREHTIALFDNDVAGHIEKAHLDSIELPANIKAMTMPDLDFARSYPTLGPEGSRTMDVNRSACAIEMFLGEALQQPGGEFVPVRWTAWKREMGLYQGEVDAKDLVTSRFLDAVAAEPNPQELRRRFPEMDKLLNAIFEAFN
ncbi:hypothetical protein SAMN06295905_3195 [Devosia lucknowensis]|uniref:HEPN/Toprim N-terminal domain-containing protein n=1 Tax=Devosia lucknowensis TaxID=1096929 RepID=A0A1Y6GDL8_9HYPH|nr:hypothetical protein [Devosia lucknowensis]SMQ85900.1 hypothetical protein SAMN06295905_3195 [Devosia lucknowensis]